MPPLGLDVGYDGNDNAQVSNTKPFDYSLKGILTMRDGYAVTLDVTIWLVFLP